MFAALGDLFSLLVPMLKIGLRILLITPLILLLLNIIKNMLLLAGEVLKNNLLGEIVLFVQIWLPFNIGQVLNWISLIAGTVLFYYAYRILVENTRNMLD